MCAARACISAAHSFGPAGDCKLPSLVRYNTKGEPVAFGADALENAAGIEGTLSRWFK